MYNILGINKNKEIVFGEFEVRENNVFVANFFSVAPFEVEESNGIEHMKELLKYCYDDEDLYKLCKQFDCRPSELAKQMTIAEGITTNADEKDCSLFTDRICIDETEYAFESIACGQYDFRKEGMLEYVNREVTEKLMNIWDNYHLKKIDNEVVNELNSLLSKIEKTPDETEKIIKYYIRKYIIEDEE